VTDTKLSTLAENVQCHRANLADMPTAVTYRQTTAHHVRVTYRLHLSINASPAPAIKLYTMKLQRNLGRSSVVTPSSRPIHSRRAQSFQPYLPGGANVDPHPIHDSLGPPHSSPKWQLDRFSRFCPVDVTFSPRFTLRHPISP